VEITRKISIAGLKKLLNGTGKSALLFLPTRKISFSNLTKTAKEKKSRENGLPRQNCSG
jgi:hypothetical protein